MLHSRIPVLFLIASLILGALAYFSKYNVYTHYLDGNELEHKEQLVAEPSAESLQNQSVDPRDSFVGNTSILQDAEINQSNNSENKNISDVFRESYAKIEKEFTKQELDQIKNLLAGRGIYFYLDETFDDVFFAHWQLENDTLEVLAQTGDLRAQTVLANKAIANEEYQKAFDYARTAIAMNSLYAFEIIDTALSMKSQNQSSVEAKHNTLLEKYAWKELAIYFGAQKGFYKGISKFNDAEQKTIREFQKEIFESLKAERAAMGFDEFDHSMPSLLMRYYELINSK